VSQAIILVEQLDFPIEEPTSPIRIKGKPMITERNIKENVIKQMKMGKQQHQEQLQRN
jgi:hypothetical protein